MISSISTSSQWQTIVFPMFPFARSPSRASRRRGARQRASAATPAPPLPGRRPRRVPSSIFFFQSVSPAASRRYPKRRGSVSAAGGRYRPHDSQLVDRRGGERVLDPRLIRELIRRLAGEGDAEKIAVDGGLAAPRGREFDAAGATRRPRPHDPCRRRSSLSGRGRGPARRLVCGSARAAISIPW